MTKCFFGVLLLSLPVAGLSDYLRVVGPAPLRFERAPAKSPGSGALSAIVPATPLAAPSTSEDDADSLVESPPAIASSGAGVTTVKSPAAFGANDLLNDPAFLSSPSDMSFTAPEMILPFFQRALSQTNGVEAGVVTPVIFTPPTRVYRPPSRATYSTPPAGHEVTNEDKK